MLRVGLLRIGLSASWLSDAQVCITLNTNDGGSPALTIEIPWTSRKASYDCVPAHSEQNSDPKLVQAIVRAHTWLADLKSGRFLIG